MDNCIQVTVIVPFFNVGTYIEECIRSVLNTDLSTEVILVNDGSTDASLEIAEQYAAAYPNVFLIHQAHAGPSIARNAGLKMAKGEYIAFVDSDDWIEKNSLLRLFENAKKNNADMVLGKMVYYYSDTYSRDIIKEIPSRMKNRIFTGSSLFTAFMQLGIYYPMACSYIYRREWINETNLLFDEHILHEDEVWTQIALCHARRVTICYDSVYYFYRKREGSIMNADNLGQRLESICYVVDRLIRFADRYAFDSKEKELKGWLLVNTARLCAQAYMMLSKANDSTLPLPASTHIDYLLSQVHLMSREAAEECRKKCMVASSYRQYSAEWRNHPWNAQFIHANTKIDKQIILFYNNAELHEKELTLWDSLPDNYTVTTDRKYYRDACAVIFDLPDLIGHLRQDIRKLPHQKWINWMQEKEESHLVLNNDKIQSWFDLTVKGNRCSFPNDDAISNSKYPLPLPRQDGIIRNPLVFICQYLNAVKHGS